MSHEEYRTEQTQLTDALVTIRDGWAILGYGLTAGKVALTGYAKYNGYVEDFQKGA